MSATGLHWREAAALFATFRGPFASVRACRICGHAETYRYTGGHRGAGMVGGNKARGRIIQHLKQAHPSEYAAAMAASRARRAIPKEEG